MKSYDNIEVSRDKLSKIPQDNGNHSQDAQERDSHFYSVASCLTVYLMSIPDVAACHTFNAAYFMAFKPNGIQCWK